VCDVDWGAPTHLTAEMKTRLDAGFNAVTFKKLN